MVYNLDTMFYVALKYDPNAERACVISGAGEGGVQVEDEKTNC